MVSTSPFVNSTKVLIMFITEEINLLPLNDTYKSIDEFDCSDSDDDMEVASNLDTEENDLIDIGSAIDRNSSGTPKRKHQ